MNDRLQEIQAAPQSRKFSPKNVEWLIAEVERLRRVKSSDDLAYEHVVEMYHAEAAEVVRLRAALTATETETSTWTHQSPLEAITIALTYLPIDCGDLYEGCLSSAQAHDGAQRVLSHLAGVGLAVAAVSETEAQSG